MPRKWFVILFLLSFCGIAAADTIKLPIPNSVGRMSLEETIDKRRSVRSFLSTSLTNNQLSQILWACQGITDPQWNFRAAPSAGSLYPLEVYVVNSNGVYHYDPLKHSLTQVTKGDKRPNLSRAALAQNYIEEAPINILITALFNKTRTKYGSRAERYVHMEAGHAAENVQLQAVALDLGSVCIGSFWDDVVNSTLGLPPEHEPLYIIPVGHEKK